MVGTIDLFSRFWTWNSGLVVGNGDMVNFWGFRVLNWVMLVCQIDGVLTDS